MLKVENLSVSYNNAVAVDNISFEVKKNEAVAILGANGTGKTTLLNAIFNTVKKSGKVIYKDRDISNMHTKDIVSMNIAYVPDKRTVFNDLTVYENLEIAAKDIITSKKRRYFMESLEHIFERFPNLKEKITLKAGYLSGGEQQMLSIAQGLIREPEMFVMDEPTAGLSPKLTKSVFEIVSFMKHKKITVLMVEQNVNKTLQYTDRAYIMNVGKIVDSGYSETFLKSKSVKKAYLGG